MDQIGEELVVLVDTLSPWDKELLLSLLAGEGLTPEDVTHLVRFCFSCSLFVSWIEPVICLKMLDYQKFFISCLKVCTHGHPDHVGNNNLFTSAKVQSVKYLSSKQSILTLRCT